MSNTEPQTAKTNEKLQELTETHRYNLAMLFVASFMTVMVIALLGTLFWGYIEIINLAAVFSGWVAAIIGFYFLQQNTAGAQAQAKEATQTAAKQTERANTEAQKRLGLTIATKSQIDELSETVNNLAKSSMELKDKKVKQVPPMYTQRLQSGLQNILASTKGTSNIQEVESLLKETKEAEKRAVSDDTLELQIKVENLVKEAQEKIKKTKETINQYST
jgi:hypothetical protein